MNDREHLVTNKFFLDQEKKIRGKKYENMENTNWINVNVPADRNMCSI